VLISATYQGIVTKEVKPVHAAAGFTHPEEIGNILPETWFVIYPRS